MIKDLTRAMSARVPSSLVKAVVPQSIRLRRHVRSVLQRATHDPEIALLPRLARAGCFLDIGANLGSWTGPASRAFARVHAFEPHAELATALRANVPPNVTVHEVALSDHHGVATFAIPLHAGEHLASRASLELDANTGFDQVIRQVAMTTLDALDLRGVDAIKIDVEGHEAATLDGAWRTIERERPTLIVEIEERHHPGRSEALIERIAARGYRCCYVARRQLLEFTPGEIVRLQPAELIPTPEGTSPDYINNFFFVPREREQQLTAMRADLARPPA